MLHLRRHLAALVDCGLVVRRDSPNGKRYARRGREGDLEEAFGFSLAPLLARAHEFEAAAERVRADNRALRLMRERITLHRRDIQKLIEAAVEEDVPGDWGCPVAAVPCRCGVNPAPGSRRRAGADRD